MPRSAFVAIIAMVGLVRQPSSALLDVLHEYRSGDANHAVIELAEWTPKEIEQVDRAVVDGQDPLSLAALALLHMEVHRTFALDDYRHDVRILTGSAADLEPHLLAARQLSHQVCRSKEVSDNPRLFEFCSLWDQTFQVVSEGARTEPLKWLLRGEVAELWAGPEIVGGPVWFTPTTVPNVPLTVTTHGRFSSRAEAAAIHDYREAIAADREFPPAHLRLGWLYYLFDQREQAGNELSGAYKASTQRSDDVDAYLSALLLGRLEEDLGHRSAAASDYSKALSALPVGQAARLSLGLLTIEDGQSVKGWRIIRSMFSAAPEEDAADPWYLFVPSKSHEAWGTTGRIARMRSLIRE